MEIQGRNRVQIQNVRPEIDCGRYAIKRVVGESVQVTADIFSDGHDEISADLLYRLTGNKESWSSIPMRFMGNDVWQASFQVKQEGKYEYTVQARIDHFKTWQRDMQKKIDAGQDVGVDKLIGLEFIDPAISNADSNAKKRLRAFADDLKNSQDGETLLNLIFHPELQNLVEENLQVEIATSYEKVLEVVVDRKKALFSSWYEFFPRSAVSGGSRHGTFEDAEKILPDVAELGFDVIYLPPIHPIGKTNRKGKNNSTVAKKEDPGSPWAIGGEAGGHKAVNPELGTIDDFQNFLKKANDLGLEVAIDLAFQCSVDHPYVKEHPEWFRWRPDGTVQFAENPPKKYEDVLPINFETENWKALWEELLDVVLFWVDKGVHIFRVDNPHTKPFLFWEWLIEKVKSKHAQVLFLSEAFTRPKIMYGLAKIGFTQSYTYFTWRNTKQEFQDYLNELTRSEVREIFRPNFWPNTPDILAEHLQFGGRPAFIVRLILAATLSSNYGIYGPAYELVINKAVLGKEEYLNSEKYEVKKWDRTKAGNIREIIKKMNRIRRESPALQTTWNVDFYETDNEHILCYGKTTDNHQDVIVVVVNLDFFNKQSSLIRLPIHKLGIPPHQSYLVEELVSETKYIWQGEKIAVDLDPQEQPGSVFRIQRRLKREQDFDYYL